MRLFFTKRILLGWLILLAGTMGAEIAATAATRWAAEALCLGFIFWMFFVARGIFHWSSQVPIRQRLIILGQNGALLLLAGALVMVLLSQRLETPDVGPSLGFRAALTLLGGLMTFLVGSLAVVLTSLMLHESGTARRVWTIGLCVVFLILCWALPADRGGLWMWAAALLVSLVTPWREDLSGRLTAAVFILGALLSVWLWALFQARLTWSGGEYRLLILIRQEMGLALSGVVRVSTFLFSAHAAVFIFKTVFSPMARVASVRGGLRTKLVLFYLFAGAVPLVLMILIMGVGFYIVLGSYRASLAKKLTTEYSESCREWAERVAADPAVLRWARDTTLGPGPGRHDAAFSESLNRLIEKETWPGSVGYLLIQVEGDSLRRIAQTVGTPGAREEGYAIPDWMPASARVGLVAEREGVWGRAVIGRVVGGRTLSVEAGLPLDVAFLERMRSLTGVDFELNNGFWLDMTVTVAGEQRINIHGREDPEGETPIEWRTISTAPEVENEALGFFNRRLYFGGAFLPEIDWATGAPSEDVAGVLLVRTSLRNLYQVLFAPENIINKLLLFVLGFLAVLFLVIILVASGVGIRIVHNVTRSVGALKRGTERVRVGDFDYRIHVTSRDEFEDLAESFNMMSAEIRRMLVAVREKEKLESELRIARDIQQRLLPQARPEISGYEVWGSSLPAREVGGDYFDYLTFGPASVGLAIGDVSGKGITAALLMANLQASLRALAREPSGIASVMTQLNAQLYQTTSPEMYATFFYGILDAEKNILSFANAGHNPPLLVRADGSVELLEEGGLPLGMMEGFPYQEGTVEFAPKDLLLLYTDGVTEAENPQKDQLGDERLREIAVSSRAESAKAIQDRIHLAVKEFAAGQDQSDDLTLITLKVLDAES